MFLIVSSYFSLAVLHMIVRFLRIPGLTGIKTTHVLRCLRYASSAFSLSLYIALFWIICRSSQFKHDGSAMEPMDQALSFSPGFWNSWSRFPHRILLIPQSQSFPDWDTLSQSHFLHLVTIFFKSCIMKESIASSICVCSLLFSRSISFLDRMSQSRTSQLGHISTCITKE